MKVGDLIEWEHAEIGIVTYIDADGDPFVLFKDGDFKVVKESITEVINETR